nr:response regulator [Prolixibacteraceae bacterium]
HIIFANKNYARLFGFELDELLLKKLDEITYSENLGESISKISQLFTGVIASFNQTTQMYCKNGDRIWINSNVSQMKDKYGDTSCAIQIVEDISRLKNEEQKNLANERIKTIKLISNYYADELFKLLNYVTRNSFALVNKIKDETLSSYVFNILKSIETADKISGEIIPFSDKNKKIDEIVSVSKLIEEIIVKFNLTSSVKITRIAESQNDRVAGDPYLLKKAFYHIIENILQSVSKKEDIFVSLNSVYFDNKDLQKNGELNKGRYLRVTISDSERIIAQSELERLFDPFNNDKPAKENTGIGLSLSKKIINQHKGLIKVFSNQQDGTKFNIYLPQNDADNYDLVIAPDEKIFGKGLLKVIIIDDEKIVRDISSKIVSGLGYDAYCFSNARKALQFFKINSNSIDFVLLDGEIPPLEGNTVLSSLKSINSNIKVIVMSGFSIDDSGFDEKIKEADGYFQKPISIEKILNLI